MAGRSDDLTENVRRICMAFPEVTERLSHGAPTWFVRGKSTFVTLWDHGHHSDEFPHLWCAAPPGVQQELVETEPDRYFRPPYVGGRGWLGLRLDVAVDWAEIGNVCEDAYRTIAPKRLVARLDSADG
jgi:hypothetical protein